MKPIGKIKISDKIFYVSEIDSGLFSDLKGYYFKIKDINYAIFRADGRLHGSRKYSYRYFILTETIDNNYVFFCTSFTDRPFIFSKFDRDFYQEFKFCEEGPDRILLIQISESIKEKYLEERDRVKYDLRELVSWGLNREKK
jgi:hypothetical protein